MVKFVLIVFFLKLIGSGFVSDSRFETLEFVIHFFIHSIFKFLSSFFGCLRIALMEVLSKLIFMLYSVLLFLKSLLSLVFDSVVEIGLLLKIIWLPRVFPIGGVDRFDTKLSNFSTSTLLLSNLSGSHHFFH
jgi:hypothetical protein